MGQHFLHRVSGIGIVAATLLFVASLTPSMVPRGATAQGVLSGVCLGLGYALGIGLRGAWRYLQLPRLPRPRAMEHLPTLLGLVGLVAVVSAVWLARPWQDSVRQVMGLPPVDGPYSLRLLLVAFATFAVLLLIGRGLVLLARATARRARRVMPVRVANALAVAVVAVLVFFVANGVILRGLLHVADASFRQADALLPPEGQAPVSDRVTGGPGSLIAWEDLGRAGRDFITNGPSQADIAQMAGGQAQAPIRVYVGLPAGPDARSRARLALRELQRVGGFDRSILVVITPTGTGWVDPAAIDSLEYLQRGDVASVAAQYSYLSSPLSLLVEPELGEESARALFAEVYGYWRTLPKAHRPRLYLHGLSLGAMNSERSLDLFDVIEDPIDGALWSGPPFASRHWRAITRARNAGSPEWLPAFRDGRFVRFMNQHGGPVPPQAPWGRARVVYLQYASDAITFFSPHDAWRAPDWMEAPRGPDVSPQLRWYPLVSMSQFALDMMLADDAPMGYGHVFAPSHYVPAWRGVLGDDDWSGAELQHLQQQLDAKRREAIARRRNATGGG
ncbi:MAG TPA: alpha/beta-hydrolase family protein [Stenotrophomonas sp.]